MASKRRSFILLILIINCIPIFSKRGYFLLSQNILLKHKQLFISYFCHWYMLVSKDFEPWLVCKTLDCAKHHDYKITNSHFVAVSCEMWDVPSLLV